MADKARKLTDQELNKLEREIYELYATASNEISAEWRKYMASHKKTLDQAYNELQEAKKSGNRDAIAEANEKYERTVKNVTLNDIRYKAMLNETTAKLANVNQIALDYVNGDMPKIYTLNYNAFGDEKIDGYTFTLVNERAVAALALSNEIRLPKKKVDIPKDEAWNAKNINSQLMQGILQGESISKIAKRLQNVTNMNRNSAIRNARTMTTGAENQGRQDSFKKASSDGILMKRRWIATHDERVRAWHSDLDGIEVDIDEPFQNDFGDIMYPGDPSADAANVYNCRCSIRAVVKGFKWNKEEDQVEEYEQTVEKSFVESLIDPDYSPNISQYKSYEEYAEARNKWREDHEGESLTRYVDDLGFENKNISTITAWAGREEDKIPRIEATIVKLNDQYPLPNTDKEYGTKVDKLIVCDYKRAWEFLPDGDADRRLTTDAAAQVFQNENQIVMAFNPNTMVSTISEDLKAREDAIKNGKILSAIGYSPEIATIHEYGHALEDHFGNAMIYQDETGMEYWKWYKSLTKDEIRQGLSDYATTNRSEFEAECFAELQMPNPRPIALKYKEYLDEVINKGY